MGPNLRLFLVSVPVFVLGLAVGEAGDPRPGAPCVEGQEEPDCERVPESEGLAFVGRLLIVAGFGMAAFAAGRAAWWALRGRRGQL